MIVHEGYRLKWKGWIWVSFEKMQMQEDSTLPFYLARWYSCKMPTPPTFLHAGPAVLRVVMHFCSTFAKSWRWHLEEVTAHFISDYKFVTHQNHQNWVFTSQHSLNCNSGSKKRVHPIYLGSHWVDAKMHHNEMVTSQHTINWFVCSRYGVFQMLNLSFGTVWKHTQGNIWLMDSLWHGQRGGPAPIMRSLITLFFVTPPFSQSCMISLWLFLTISSLLFSSSSLSLKSTILHLKNVLSHISEITHLIIS